MNPKILTVESVAEMCHEANRSFCHGIGDDSQFHWHLAEQWQRESAIKGVLFRLDNPEAPACAQHDAWTKDKLDGGWKFGPVKDPAAKTHPCLVSYTSLPAEQQAKDALFCGIVDAVKHMIVRG